MKSTRILMIVLIAAFGYTSVTLGEPLPDGKNIIVNFNKELGITVTRPDLATQDYCCTFKSGIKCSANPCSQCNCAGNSVVIDVKNILQQ